VFPQLHSLDSSTISAHVTGDGVDATITVAIDTLDTALGTDLAATGGVGADADEVVAYLADHLTVTGQDGSVWTETFSELTRESVEGIDSLSVDVTFDPGGSTATAFEIEYDAIIESVPGHEAVVVLTDATGNVSTPGVIGSSADTVTIGLSGQDVESSTTLATGFADMVGYGFHHVLQGADHLLFLTTLLLTAPLVVSADRWQRRGGVAFTASSVLGMVTAFTIGHSVTLIASALGWVTLPTTPVEVLVAASVAVAGWHVLRPLFRHGEQLIAAGFGLVHGLAFAGILVDLGLERSTSLTSLLAFNLGVELAQLAATALLFPSLYVLSTTRFFTAVRIVGGVLAIVAATGWTLERLGLLTSPLTRVEAMAIEHPWAVVALLALLAATARAADTTRRHEARSSAPPFVLVGGLPGAGKTTVIGTLQQHAADVEVVDPDQLRRCIARRLPFWVPYRCYRPVVHTLNAVRLGAVLLRGPRTSAGMVVHDPATRPRRRRLTGQLARWRGWRPRLLVLDVSAEEALEGQRRRARVVRSDSFTRHQDRWLDERRRLTATASAAADHGAWDRIEVVDRDRAAATLAVLLRPHPTGHAQPPPRWQPTDGSTVDTTTTTRK
jgi:predicted kinase